MKTEARDRRRYSRDGVFGQIEDATHRVLRRIEKAVVKSDGEEPAEFADAASIAGVNVTLGLPACKRLGEPY